MIILNLKQATVQNRTKERACKVLTENQEQNNKYQCEQSHFQQNTLCLEIRGKRRKEDQKNEICV